MIWLYTGTPGSGKSLHAIKDIQDALSLGKRVIANFPVRTTKAQEKKGRAPIFWDNTEITVKRLFQFAKKNHKRGKEHQTLLIMDEAQLLFNCRAFSAAGRMDWVRFFSIHRHLGYDIIMITQWDRMLDRQIRVMAEYDVIHRNVNRFRLIGLFLTLMKIKLFVAIEVWYGVKEINSKTFFRGSKKLYRLYDSYANFKGFEDDDEADEKAADAALSPILDYERRELLERFAACLEARRVSLGMEAVDGDGALDGGGG